MMIILQESAEILYGQLKDELHLYGMTELTKILISEVPVKLVPEYLGLLTILEWTSKHIPVQEEK